MMWAKGAKWNLYYPVYIMFKFCYNSVLILQYDFTMWGGLLFVFLIILILFGLFAAIFHNKVINKHFMYILKRREAGTIGIVYMSKGHECG